MDKDQETPSFVAVVDAGSLVAAIDEAEFKLTATGPLSMRDRAAGVTCDAHVSTRSKSNDPNTPRSIACFYGGDNSHGAGVDNCYVVRRPVGRI